MDEPSTSHQTIKILNTTRLKTNFSPILRFNFGRGEKVFQATRLFPHRFTSFINLFRFDEIERRKTKKRRQETEDTAINNFPLQEKKEIDCPE